LGFFSFFGKRFPSPNLEDLGCAAATNADEEEQPALALDSDELGDKNGGGAGTSGLKTGAIDPESPKKIE
jgi:hypothetical protein